MPWGLGGAFAASLLYGVATILQAVAVGRTTTATTLDPRLLVRLLRSGRYLAAVGCDILGFGLSLLALRTLPLFLVQAVVSSSLAVTAVLARVFLRVRLRAPEWVAIGVVCVGLTLLAVSAGPQNGGGVDLGGRLSLLLTVGVLSLVAVLAARIRPSGAAGGSWALGVLAGVGYGIASVGARILAHPSSLGGLLSDPAAYAIALSGLLAMLLYAQALQRGSVTVTTAAVVATETMFPAAVGLFLLSDHPRRGMGAVSAVGFALTVLAALRLARHGEGFAPAAVSPAGPAPSSSPAAPRPPRSDSALP